MEMFPYFKTFLEKEYNTRYCYAFKANSIFTEILDTDNKVEKQSLTKGVTKSEFKIKYDNVYYIIEIYHFNDEKTFKNFKRKYKIYYYLNQFYFSLYEINGNYFVEQNIKKLSNYFYSTNERKIILDSDIFETINNDISNVRKIENGPSWDDIKNFESFRIIKELHERNEYYDNILKMIVKKLIPILNGYDFDWMNRKNFKLENSYPIDLV